MKPKSFFFTDECGSVSVMVVVLMFVLVGLLAFVIDLAHVKTVKTELSNAADSCCLRGARAFLPDELDPIGPQAFDPDPVRAKDEAQANILRNKSDNTAFQTPDTDLPQGDIEVGIWDYEGKFTASGKPDLITPWEWPPPSSMWGEYIGPGIRLPTKRTEDTSLGSVGSEKNENLSHARMIMARIFGISSINVHARATAALSGVGGYRQGGMGPDFPMCLSKSFIDQVLHDMANGGTYEHGIYDLILGPAQSDNAGWTNLQGAGDTTSAHDIHQWFDGNMGPGELTPSDNEVHLNNGVICSATKALIDNSTIGLRPQLELVEVDSYPNYNDSAPANWPPVEGNKAYVPDPTAVNSENGGMYGYPWDANNNIPTYTFAVCESDTFNRWHAISAISAKILAVFDAPDCTMRIQITGTVTALDGTYGGGPFYGVLSTEPKLVQ